MCQLEDAKGPPVVYLAIYGREAGDWPLVSSQWQVFQQLIQPGLNSLT